MGEVVSALSTIICLLGNNIRHDLQRAMESDDLFEVKQLLKDAHEAMNTIIQSAKALKRKSMRLATLKEFRDDAAPV